MFLDIGVGILLSILVSRLFNTGLTGGFIWAGVALALLPDIDVVVELWQRKGKLGGKVAGFHRTCTHYPLLYLPIAAVVWLVFGLMWAALFGSAVLVHFIHDSVGTGWGIKWLWPFSQKRYKFFAGKDGRVSKNLVVSWAPTELAEAMAKYGDPDWFKNIYLRPSAVFVVELAVFVLSLAVLYLAAR